MTKEIWNGITVLIADEGAYVTNEETYSQRVYLGKNASETDWRDATAEEYEEWLNREPDDVDADEAMEILFGGD